LRYLIHRLNFKYLIYDPLLIPAGFDDLKKSEVVIDGIWRRMGFIQTRKTCSTGHGHRQMGANTGVAIVA
jgi:hypothetical protein